MQFEEEKAKFTQELEALIKSYDALTKTVSPKHWRRTGEHYHALKMILTDINSFEPLSKKDLQNELVKELLEKDFTKN